MHSTNSTRLLYHIWSWAYRSWHCVKTMSDLSLKQHELLSSNAQFQTFVVFVSPSVSAFNGISHIACQKKLDRYHFLLLFFIVLKFPNGESEWFRFDANGIVFMIDNLLIGHLFNVSYRWSLLNFFIGELEIISFAIILIKIQSRKTDNRNPTKFNSELSSQSIFLLNL